ncbi:hypothetical protein [Lewinella sp. IMCC34191]|uniref:hypothetical protein n=1 Tax=Lewinella sp. IMCC34191 TaxID=2259172 RepID=UPI000E274A63|nr:hypothetical protein [Lewinella sp. IMCC34191]
MKQFLKNRKALLSLAAILVLGFIMLRAVYPDDDFYLQDFTEVTGIEFPKKAEFLYTTASFPDHHGDYVSASLIKVESEFYKQLPDILVKRGMVENDGKTYSDEFEKALEKAAPEEMDRELSIVTDTGAYYYVGFLSDQETILVNRMSW